jgi:Domain of unknown function (DUF4905)
MLSLFISEKFNGTIWRMEIDSLSETLFVEIRNSEEKLVSFASVNLSTGKINFNHLTTRERWLTGIESAYDGVLLLHNYQSENSPVHKGLTAIDAITGETIWSNYTYAFDHLSVNGPVVYNIQLQPKKLILADIKTGAAIQAYLPEIDQGFVNNITLPQILPLSYLQQKLDIEPHGSNMHYLEYNNLIIVSLHSAEGGLLNQRLYVVDDAAVVYEDILNTAIQKIQPEAFIVHHNCLIYIKNKAELKVINL